MSMINVVYAFNSVILIYMLIINFFYVVLLVVSIPDIISRNAEAKMGALKDFLHSESALPVTALITAYNEELTILDTISSILKSDYPNINIIILNDGSTDDTFKKLNDVFQLQKADIIIPQLIKTYGKFKGYYVSKTHPNITVVDKENSKKSDTLNVGLNVCRTPFFMTVDADTLLEPNAISNIVLYTLTHPNVAAVGGAIYLLNGCDYKDGVILSKNISMNPICALQSAEYMRGFLFGRAGWNVFSGALCYAGAFTLFNHKAVLDVGGFDRDNIGQDFEIITHLQAHRYEKNRRYTLGYTASAVAWTCGPETLSDYWKQRTGWQNGSMRSILRYKRMFFNPYYGIVGLFSYPFYLLVEVFGVLVEFAAYFSVLVSWYFGFFDPHFAILFFILCYGFVAFISVATALINYTTNSNYKRIFNVLWVLVVVTIECFGFRQYVAICRVTASIKYFFRWLCSPRLAEGKEAA